MIWTDPHAAIIVLLAKDQSVFRRSGYRFAL